LNEPDYIVTATALTLAGRERERDSLPLRVR
jgi:hypothetical protein